MEKPLKNLKTSSGPLCDLDLSTHAKKYSKKSHWTVPLIDRSTALYKVIR
jgi:hypothetical protein